ncbi:hypothetical protein GCM10017667_19020 [Streptomyces filamentosus]|uniref:VCBS repeat-containing protein n=1 Tax=Streptomyces filamentosus TaxID=67294 RepID=A0A919BIS9_STRFL|nr:hypothetical protein GCM10017667_19020 [Streptomyces filamentosus]
MGSPAAFASALLTNGRNVNHRISGRRLAAALLTLATVTAVTGTLVAVPASAAPAGASAGERCAPAAGRSLPVGAEVVAAGSYGFLTSCRDENGETRLSLHRTDGTVTPYLGQQAYDTGSDWIVTDNQGSIGAYNPATNQYSTSFPAGGEIVGAAHDVVYESRSVGDGPERELYQVQLRNGVLNRTKLTDTYGSERETGHKVLGSGTDANGRPVAYLSTRGLRDDPTGGRPLTYGWSTVVPVPLGSVVPAEAKNHNTGTDLANLSGDVTEKHRALVLPDQTAPGYRLYATPTTGTARRDVPLTNVPGVPVLAGVVGDTAFYAAKRDPYGDPAVLTPLYALDLTQAAPVPRKVMENFSSAARPADGTLVVRGATGTADGVFRIGRNGDLTPELLADTGAVVALKVVSASVPGSVSLQKPGTTVPFAVALNRPGAAVQLTLTHQRTGKKLVTQMSAPLGGDGRPSYSWNGILDGISAPNGAYSWRITATDGAQSDTVSGSLTVSRTADLHDFNDNGSTDLLARDSAGVLWRDDLYDWPVAGQVKPAKRTRIGSGWNAYKQIEAAGTLDGGATGDLIAVDTQGVLWSYTGKGDGTFGTRVRVGGGWGSYTQLAAGSDWQTADRSSDLFAADTSGVLWYHRATGDPAKPYFPRVRVGGGWNAYNQITAVGNIVGDVGGELVARDKDGVLWLYQSDGFRFLPRVRVGGGWNAFTQLVGAGDLTGDGRPDLVAYGPGGTYVYRANGTVTGAFTRQTTTLYAGEGGRFTSVS